MDGPGREPGLFVLSVRSPGSMSQKRRSGYPGRMDFDSTSLIVLAVLILGLIGVIYGMKTRKGSGINRHPGPGTGDPARGPESSESANPPESERADSSLLDQHGKR